MAVVGEFISQSHSHNLINFPTCFPNPVCKAANFRPPSHFPSRSFKQFSVSSSSSVSNSVELQHSSADSTPPGWSEFGRFVSGEWDGFGADFTSEGRPIELPESVVPEAFREWEVKVFDWQTQCPTLANQHPSLLSYRSIKLLPTVGCEADAATVHSSDERIIGGEGSKGLAAAYHHSGSYVSVWSLGGQLLEVEHCLIDPSNHESRVRVLQIIRIQDTTFTSQSIKVFCELWYGPFRNGDQLGGCAIRDSGFASADPLKPSQVAGVWRSHQAVANFNDSHQKVFQELIGETSHEIVRDECSLITLPRQLWCSLNKSEDGETCAEVGWLLDSESAISSRCIFTNGCNIKEIVMGRDTIVAGNKL